MMDFHALKRKELQELCKKHGIPANLKNVDMADRLSSLLLKEEKPDNAVRKGRSCLKSVSEVVEVESVEKVENNNNKEVKKVRFSPENQTFLFDKTDPRAVRLMARKKRSFVKLGKDENPVVDSCNLVESQSLDDASSVEYLGRRNLRRKSVVISENVGLVGETNENVGKLGVKGGNLKRNLRSRRGKLNQESPEMISLLSPCGVDKGGNVVEGRNPGVDTCNLVESQSLDDVEYIGRRNLRRKSVVISENVGLVGETDENLGELGVEGGNLGRNLRSRRGKLNQESPEMISLLSTCGVDKEENVVEGRNLRRNSRRSMVQKEDVGSVCENDVEMEKSAVKRGFMDRKLRSREGKVNRENVEVVLLSPGVDNVEKKPVEEGNLKRHLRSRGAKADKETVEVVSLFSPCGVDNLGKQLVEGGILKRSQRSRGGKANDNVAEENKAKKSRRGKRSQEEGGYDETVDQRGNDGRVEEKVNSKEDVVERTVEKKSRKSDRRKTLILKRQDINENVTKKPAAAGVDHSSAGFTPARILSESSQPKFDEAMASVDIVEEKSSAKDVGESAEPNVQTLANASAATPLLQTNGDSGATNVREIQSDLISVAEYTLPEATVTPSLSISKDSPSLRSEAQYGDATFRQLEQTNCRDFGYSLHNMFSDDGICNTDGSKSLESKMDDSAEVLQDRFVKQAGKLEADASLSEEVSDYNSGVQIHDTTTCFLPENREPEVPEPYHAAGDSIQMEQSVENLEVAIQYSPNSSLRLSLAHETEKSEECCEEKGTKETTPGKAELISLTPVKDNALSTDNGSSLRSMDGQYDASNVEELEQSNRTFVSSLKHLFSEDDILNTDERKISKADNDDDAEGLLYTRSISQETKVDASLSEQVAYDQEHQKMEEATQISPSSSLQLNLAHESTRSEISCEEKGIDETTCEKLELHSLSPPKDNDSTCFVMQKSDHDVEQLEQVGSDRTVEFSLQYLFSEGDVLCTDESKSTKSERDDVAEDLQFTRSISRVAETKVDASLSEQVAYGYEHQIFSSCSLESNLACETTQSEDCCQEKGADEMTPEHAELNSLTPAKANDSTPYAMQMSDNEPLLRSVEVKYDKSTVEQLELASNSRFFESTLRHMFSEDDILNTNASKRAKSKKYNGDEDLTDTRAVSHAAETEVDPSLSEQEADDHEHESMTNSSANNEQMAVRLVNEGSEARECSVEQLEQVGSDRTVKFSLQYLVSENDIHCTDESNSTKSEKDDIAEDLEFARSISQVTETKVDASLSKPMAYDSEHQIISSCSLESNLACETTQSEECCQKKGTNETASEHAELNSSTPAKENDSAPHVMQMNDNGPLLRSMEVKYDKSAIEQSEPASNSRFFESSLWHVFSEDDILNTNESKQAKSRKDDGDNDLKDMRSIIQAAETTVDPSLCEQVPDDQEHESMNNIDANNEEMTVRLVNEGSEARECSLRMVDDKCTKEFASGGSTECSPSVSRETVVDAHYHETEDFIQFEHNEENFDEATKLSPEDSEDSERLCVAHVMVQSDIGSEAKGIVEKISARAEANSQTLAKNDCSLTSVTQNSGNEEEVQEVPLEVLALGDNNTQDNSVLTPSAIVRGTENKTSISSTENENCLHAIEAINCSSASYMATNCEALNADKEHLSSSLSEIKGEKTETVCSENEGLPKAPVSENEMGDTMDSDALIDDKLTVQLTKKVDIATSVKECDSISSESDSDTMDLDALIDDKLTVQLTEKLDIATSIKECEIISSENDGGEQLDDFSSAEKLIVACDGLDEGIVQSSCTVKESENMKIVAPPQDGAADCRNQNPVSVSESSVKALFFLQPEKAGELTPISSLAENGEETNKETTTEDVACSKRISKADNLALADSPAFKQAEEANNSINPKVQHLVLEAHLMNVEDEKCLESGKALRVDERNVISLGEDEAHSGAPQDMKLSELEFCLSADDNSADLNCFITEEMRRDIDEMFQDAESIPHMPQDEVNYMFDYQCDNYVPPADSLKHGQCDQGELVESEARKPIAWQSAMEMHHEVTSETSLSRMDDGITGRQNQAECYDGFGVQGNYVAGITENAFSVGRINEKPDEVENFPEGPKDFRDGAVAHEETATLEDGSEKKLCAEADSEITGSRITQQNDNENEVNDQTHIVQVDVCNIADNQLASEQTVPHDISEASDCGAYSLGEKSLNSEATKQCDGDEGSSHSAQMTVNKEYAAATTVLDLELLKTADDSPTPPCDQNELDFAPQHSNPGENIGLDSEEPGIGKDAAGDVIEKDAQSEKPADAIDGDEDMQKLKRQNRSILIHATPRKPVLPKHDMKENMTAPKRSQMVNATLMKPKRKALGDI
ncbi:hypothetical protein RND81_01G156600 [Saponaria officinalis]|uniref:SAP domain-containing protein n=1 Tax=Saponaria officinalis TaxID=3572 RepID=A0AAW1NJ03_SAPOF